MFNLKVTFEDKAKHPEIVKKIKFEIYETCRRNAKKYFSRPDVKAVVIFEQSGKSIYYLKKNEDGTIRKEYAR